jgi:putative DNA primase/helicase
LAACIFDPTHDRGEAGVILCATGMRLYKCHHNSCSKKKWEDVRARLEPPDEPTEPDDIVRLTDLGNARRLVAAHGADLRYCKAWKCWLAWDGRRWARDERDRVMVYAKQITASLFRAAAEIQDLDRQKQLVQHALRSQKAERLRGMVLLAQSEPGIPVLPAELDTDPWLLNVLNGTIDLRTGALRAHRHEDLLTKLARVHYTPGVRLDLWDCFLREATEGGTASTMTDAEAAADLRGFLQRAVGYSLTGDTSEEVFFLIHGPEAAGKSTFTSALKATLGDYATTADFGTFLAKQGDGGIRNDIADLAGARCVTSVEVDEGKTLAQALVKFVTGGDVVKARFLYCEHFEFKPTFKLWLAVNHAPRVEDLDGAMWRRIRRLPFEHTVAEDKRDKTLKATLTTPAIAGSAILAWAVEGCLAWQRDGLGNPPVVEAATAAYRDEQDPLRDFYAEACTFEQAATIASAALYAEYVDWAKGTGVRTPLSAKAVGVRLKAHGCGQGFEKITTAAGKRKSVRVWVGIRLRTEQDDPTEAPPPATQDDGSGTGVHASDPDSDKPPTENAHEGRFSESGANAWTRGPEHPDDEDAERF